VAHRFCRCGTFAGLAAPSCGLAPPHGDDARRNGGEMGKKVKKRAEGGGGSDGLALGGSAVRRR
jgi:hypothetical protein